MYGMEKGSGQPCLFANAKYLICHFTFLFLIFNFFNILSLYNR